ncbi:MAG: 30S ribosomal protein S16 [bacterium]|nr:30S ribosomal protein S16 [bacterium]
MLTIRLSRVGKKKHPIFRVIVSEKVKDTVGDYLELLGHYNPHTNTAELKAERIKHWISKGAQTSGTIHNLLVEQKIISAEKIKVANIKKKKEENKNAEENKPESKTDKPEEKPIEEKKEEKKPEEKPEAPKPEEKKEAPTEKPDTKPAEEKSAQGGSASGGKE